jgi:PAS domain S-box-containing protein
MASNLDDLAGVVAVNQLAAIIWSADDAIIGKRLDGTITSWNLGAEQLFGYAAADIIGRAITQLLPPDRIGEEAAIIDRLVRGERIRHFETVRRRKDGSLVDVSVSIAPVVDANGAVVGASKIARDISDLVATRRREQRLVQLMRSLAQANRAMARASADGELVGEICRICTGLEGVAAAWVMHFDQPVPRCQPGVGLAPAVAESLTQRPDVQALAAQALASGQCGTARLPLPPQWLASAATAAEPGAAFAAVPIGRGADAGGALMLAASAGTVFDELLLDVMAELATDLAVALNQRGRTHEFEGIVQAASDAIIAVDSERRILRINPAASEMFLWPEAQALGQRIDRLIPGPFRSGHAALMARFASQESQPRRMGPARALTGLRINGEEFPIEATVSRFGKGSGLRMIVVVRDVSALRRAEQAMAARQAAEAANQAKTEFLSHMSHELRTPLNAILGFTQVLLDTQRPPTAERRLDHLRQIRTAGRHLHVLISDLLDMARLEVGQLQVQCRPVSMQALLDDVLAVLDPLARAAELRIARAVALQALPRVMADATRLKQVFLNLLSNALKYNRPGGTVRLDATLSADAVSLCVEDTGIGMSAEQLSRLFEPYNRLGREGSPIVGVGIGLVVTKQLVERMGGSLRFESIVGQGTRAWVTLPCARGDAPPDTFQPTAPGGLDAEPPLTGRVLSVEDNPVNQLLLEAVFVRWPAVRLLHAIDGQTALALVRAHAPDVILLDMHLPDMDGFEFMASLVERGLLAHSTVLILSANAEAADVERALAMGANGYLTKPIDLPQFVDALRAALHAQRAPGGGP